MEEALGAAMRDVPLQDLYGNHSVVPEVTSQVDGSHPAAAELPLHDVASFQRSREARRVGPILRGSGGWRWQAAIGADGLGPPCGGHSETAFRALGDGEQCLDLGAERHISPTCRRDESRT